jgi:hypothetical protein
MSSYTSAYPPSVEIKQEYKTFFEEFYRISDTLDAHEEYVQQFPPDAVVIIASKCCEGSSGRYLLIAYSLLYSMPAPFYGVVY